MFRYHNVGNAFYLLLYRELLTRISITQIKYESFMQTNIFYRSRHLVRVNGHFTNNPKHHGYRFWSLKKDIRPVHFVFLKLLFLSYANTQQQWTHWRMNAILNKRYLMSMNNKRGYLNIQLSIWILEQLHFFLIDRQTDSLIYVGVCDNVYSLRVIEITSY